MIKKFLLTTAAFILFAVVAVLILSLTTEEEPVRKQVIIQDAIFNVEIADTALTRSRGLAGRGSLSENAGMLFIFPEAGVYNFWMKGMKFPIDFIWINGDEIIGFTENAQPAVEGQPISIYIPPEPVDKVLEVPAGTVAEIGIKPGDGFLLSQE